MTSSSRYHQISLLLRRETAQTLPVAALDIGTGLPTVGSVHEIGPGWPGSRRTVGFRLVGADEAGPAGPAVRIAALTISRALGARAVP